MVLAIQNALCDLQDTNVTKARWFINTFDNYGFQELAWMWCFVNALVRKRPLQQEYFGYEKVV